MKCSNCSQDIGEADQFCPWCGAPQADSSSPGNAEPEPGVEVPEGTSLDPSVSASQDRELRELRSDVDAVTTEVVRISLRLSDLERQRVARPAGQRQVAPSAPAPAPVPERPTTAPTASAPTPVGERVPVQPAPRAATPAVPSRAGHAEAAQGRAYASGQAVPLLGRLLLPEEAALAPLLCLLYLFPTSASGTGSGWWEATGWPASGWWR